jgi:three-Cys-motif partner protein
MTDPWAEILAGHSRQNGSYAAFFDRYLPPAFAATRRKLTRHYVDLFAGPGVWHEPYGLRHQGSPLAALQLSATVPPGHGFTEVFLVNKDQADHDALSARVDLMVERGLTNLPRAAIHTVHADANDAAPDILRRIHQKSWIFVYADIERPAHWPWATVEALRAQGHESLDLYMLFPLHMGVRRILGFTQSHPEAITRFYGCEDWRPVVARRTTSAHSRRFLREMETLYADRLRSAGWPHVSRQRRVSDVGSRTLYYMFFATSHPAAKALSDWEGVSDGDERHRDQTELF